MRRLRDYVNDKASEPTFILELYQLLVGYR